MIKGPKKECDTGIILEQTVISERVLTRLQVVERMCGLITSVAVLIDTQGNLGMTYQLQLENMDKLSI